LGRCSTGGRGEAGTCHGEACRDQARLALISIIHHFARYATDRGQKTAAFANSLVPQTDDFGYAGRTAPCAASANHAVNGFGQLQG
jgi:hypothetical protein